MKISLKDCIEVIGKERYPQIRDGNLIKLDVNGNILGACALGQVYAFSLDLGLNFRLYQQFLDIRINNSGMYGYLAHLNDTKEWSLQMISEHLLDSMSEKQLQTVLYEE